MKRILRIDDLFYPLLVESVGAQNEPFLGRRTVVGRQLMLLLHHSDSKSAQKGLSRFQVADKLSFA